MTLSHRQGAKRVEIVDDGSVDVAGFHGDYVAATADSATAFTIA